MLYNLFNNISFIHIGKCGGTTIRTTIVEDYNFVKYHLQRNYKNNENYIIWIRNPIKRFVSAFYYVKNVINTDISNLNITKISLDNCTINLPIQTNTTMPLALQG